MKRQQVLISALVAVVLGGGIWWYTTQYTPAPKPAANTSNENTNTVVELPTTVSYRGVDGKNALELLQASHSVIEDNGFVQSIDGRPNSSTIYWFLYVNGQSATVGAKELQTKSTDTIEWRFEEYKPQ